MAAPRKPLNAQQRAAHAQAQARYRSRQKSLEAGTPITSGAMHRRQAAIVTRAVNRVAASRTARLRLIESLPNVRTPNEPEETLYVPPERRRGEPYKASRAGQQRQAAALLEGEAAHKLQAVGASRQQQLRDELRHGPNAARLQEVMDSEQQSRFQYLSEKMARNSRQSLAILFNYAGGAGDYSSILHNYLLASQPDIEEGLNRLEALTELASRAAVLYSPKRIGTLRV